MPTQFYNFFKNKFNQRTIEPSDEAWEKLNAMLEDKPKNRKLVWYKYLNVAASIVVFLGLGLYFYSESTPAIDSRIDIEQNSQPIVNQTIQTEIKENINPKTVTEKQISEKLQTKSTIDFQKKQQNTTTKSNETNVLASTVIDEKAVKNEVYNIASTSIDAEEEVEQLLAKVSKTNNGITTKKINQNQLLAETDEDEIEEQEKPTLFKERAKNKIKEIIYVAYTEKRRIKKQK